MKVSLITTILNEEKNIESFLHSIEEQTVLPDEVIIVDGGSKDKTLERIKEYKSEKLKITVLVEKPNDH